ncbi:MAG TPA: response regulator [Aggregatilineaceae bacterium]|nr:response regulator [Aggregatilineaceae bacterium]
MAGKTIAIVDDEPHIVDMLSTFLQIKGYRTCSADSGEKVLVLLQLEQPDALLLDLMLPDIDGFEVLARLRAAPDYAKLPVLIVSARTDLASKTRAEQAGANGYFTKPVRMPDLIAALERLLNSPPAAPPASASSSPESG